MAEKSEWSEGSEGSEWDSEWEAEVKDQIAAIAGDDEMIDEEELRGALEEEGVSDWEIDAIVDHAAEYADDEGKVDLETAWLAYNDWMDWEDAVWSVLEDIAGEDEMIEEDELRGALEEEDLDQEEIDAIVDHAAGYANDEGKVDLDSAWQAYLEWEEEEEEE